MLRSRLANVPQGARRVSKRLAQASWAFVCRYLGQFWWPLAKIIAITLAKTARAFARRSVRIVLLSIAFILPLAVAGSMAYGSAVGYWYGTNAVNQYRADRSLSYPPTFAQAINFARRMDALADRFEQADKWGMRVSDESGAIQVQLGSVWQDLISNDPKLIQWAVEIVPYFEYEGLLFRPVWPEVIVWTPMMGMAHNHVLGTARCGFNLPQPGVPSRILNMNYRFVNPISPWNEYRNPLTALVHELAHFNGLCSGAWDMESATQIATIETLAAMANHGNRYALRALIDELKHIAMGYARSETYVVTLKGKPVKHLDRLLPAWLTLEKSLSYHVDPVKWAAYDAVVRGLEPGILNQARIEKSRRFWEQDPDQLFSIVVRYSRVPFLYMADAMRTTPPYAFSRAFPKDKLLLDDLAYILDHLDKLVDEALKGVPQ